MGCKDIPNGWKNKEKPENMRFRVRQGHFWPGPVKEYIRSAMPGSTESPPGAKAKWKGQIFRLK